MLCRLHRADINRMLQIIDRLCASVHYRQAVSCENSGASMAASPSSDCLVRITMSHHKVVHLPASPQQAAASAAAGQLLRLPGLSHLFTAGSIIMVYNCEHGSSRSDNDSSNYSREIGDSISGSRRSSSSSSGNADDVNNSKYSISSNADSTDNSTITAARLITIV